MPTMVNLVSLNNAFAADPPTTMYNLLGIRQKFVQCDASFPDMTHAIYPDPGTSAGVEISQPEAVNIVRFIASEFAQVWAQRDANIAGDYAYHIFVGAFVAKEQIRGQIGPAVSGGSLILQVIRPVTVYSNAGTTSTWLKTNVAAGWTATVWNIDLSTLTSGNIVRTPANRVVMLVIAEADLDPSPKLLEIQWKESGNNPLEIDSMPQLAMQGSSGIHRRKQALLIATNKKFTADMNNSAAGTSTPVVVGVQYVNKDYATAQSA